MRVSLAWCDSGTHVTFDLCTHVTWLIYWCEVQDRGIHVTWLFRILHVTWRMHTCDITYSWMWWAEVNHLYWCMWHDSAICIDVHDVSQPSILMYVTWLGHLYWCACCDSRPICIDVCDETHAYTWCYSLMDAICKSWGVWNICHITHMRDVTHAYTWHDSCIDVSCRSWGVGHTCHMTHFHSYISHELCIRVAWLMHRYELQELRSGTYMSYDSFSFKYDMTRAYMWHDSFVDASCRSWVH